VSDLTSELQRLADDAASKARPPAAAEIIRQGDRHRRRSLTRQSVGGLSAAGVIGTGIALGLGLTGSAPALGTATIRTEAFTLVSKANGTVTLTINANVLLQPGTLQRDLAHDGIPAMVTVGRFCSSDPAPAVFSRVVSFQKLTPGADLPLPGLIKPKDLQPKSPWGKPKDLLPKSPWGKPKDLLPRLPWGKPRHLPVRTLTIDRAAMPAGTELSFGNFRLADGEETFFALINADSYSCTSTAPTSGPPGGGEISLTHGAS
jgi:hypothetical protein